MGFFVLLGSFAWGKKGKGAHEPKAQTAEAYPGFIYPAFIGMKHLGVLVLPHPPPPPHLLDGMLVHRRYVAGTHLYTCVKRNKVE